MIDYSKVYNPDIEAVPQTEPVLTDIINPLANYDPQPVYAGRGASQFLDGFEKKYNGGDINTLLQPFSYDPIATNKSRYDQSDYKGELGFDPFRDNEQLYGERQTWGDVLGNALSGGARLAGQTFVEGWKGWGYMADALFSWDSKKLAGSQEDLAELYEEQQGIMNKYAIFSTAEGRDGILNREFFGTMLQQSGFAIGATAQFLSEELLTLGLSTEFSLAKLGTTAARTAEMVKRAERINDLRKLNNIWKSNTVVNGIVNGAKKFIPFANTVDDFYKYNKAGASALQLAYIGAGGVKRTLSEANMAMSEARMEAAGTYGDLSKKLSEDYFARTGEQPDSAEQEKIGGLALQAAQENFAINTGILMVANKIQFDNLFNKFGSERKLLKAAGQYGDDVFKVSGKTMQDGVEKSLTQVYKKGTLGAAGAFSEIAADFGKKTAAWEATKSIGKGLFKWEASEGIQEMLQEVSNNSLQDYYYDMYHGTKGYSYSSSVAEAFENQFTSKEGFKTFLMGALTGRLISPMTFALQKGAERLQTSAEDRSKRKADINDQVNLLNNYYKDPKTFLKEEIANFKAQEAAAAGMATGAGLRNQYTYNNFKDSSFAKMVSAAKKTDMFESVLDNIREYGDNLTPAEFKEAFSIDPKEYDIQNPKQYFEKIAAEVEEFSTNWELLNDKYGELVMPTLFEKGTVEYTEAIIKKKALDDAIEILATNKFKAERARVRANKILADVQSNKSVGASSSQAFRVLGNEKVIQQEMDLLTQEIASLKNLAPSKETAELIENKTAELQALKNWKENWKSLEKPEEAGIKSTAAFQAYDEYIKLKNKQYNIDQPVSADDIMDTYSSFVDYIKLNQDSSDYIDAYNVLADPNNFSAFHQKSIEAIKQTAQRLLEEHKAELKADVNADPAEPKKEVSYTITDESGNESTITLTEGDQYITKADEKNVIFKGKPVKTYNNSLLEIVSIEDDKISFKWNKGKVYTATIEELKRLGKLWNLKEMSIPEQIYFKNRDIKLTININSKTGKPHLITGEYADKDYSKGGKMVGARLKLEKINGVNVLKIVYTNPVTKNVESFDYSGNYLKKYGDPENKVDLRLSPTEEDVVNQEAETRRAANLTRQKEAISEVLTDTRKKLEENSSKVAANRESISKVGQEVQDLKDELELVLEELQNNPYSKGRKSNYRKELEKLKESLPQSIAEKEALLISLSEQRDTVLALQDSLNQARTYYETALEQLDQTSEPFSRSGNENLATETEAQVQNLQSAQMSKRLSDSQIDSLLSDTEVELSILDEQVTSLQNYIKDLKDILGKIIDLDEFLSFPESLTTADALRNFLRNKIGKTQDPKERARYQAVMKNFLKGKNSGQPDIIFYVNSLRESIQELSAKQAELEQTQQKYDRLWQAAVDRDQINTFQQKADYLKAIDEAIQKGVAAIKAKQPAVQNTPAAKTVVRKSYTKVDKELGDYDTAMASEGVETDEDESIFFLDVAKPLLSTHGLLKTAGKHMNNEDTEVNSPEDARFFKFTSEAAHNSVYHLQAIASKDDDFFGIRTPQFYAKDVKLIVVAKQADGSFRPVGVDGKVLENPTKDNIVYTSMVGDKKILEVSDQEALTYLKSDQSPFTTKGMSDEEILQKINEFKAERKAVQDASIKGDPVYFSVTGISSGIQNRVPLITEVNAEGKTVSRPQELPLNGRLIEQKPNNWKALKHPDGTPVSLEVVTRTSLTRKKVKPGRLILVKKGDVHDSIIQVYNRKISKEEGDNIIELLKFIAPLMGRRKISTERIDQLKDLLANKTITQEQYNKLTTPLTEQETKEFDQVIQFLMGTLFWKQPKDEGDVRGDQFYISKGKLVRIIRTRNEDNTFKYDKLMVDFNTTSIENNREALLNGLYHGVNNKKVEDVNSAFTEVMIDNEGQVVTRPYTNYQEFLLSDKNNRTPVVYTNIVEYDTNSTKPQLKSVYLTYSSNESPAGSATVVPEDIAKLIASGVVQYIDDQTGEKCS